MNQKKHRCVKIYTSPGGTELQVNYDGCAACRWAGTGCYLSLQSPAPPATARLSASFLYEVLRSLSLLPLRILTPRAPSGVLGCRPPTQMAWGSLLSEPGSPSAPGPVLSSTEQGRPPGNAWQPRPEPTSAWCSHLSLLILSPPLVPQHWGDHCSTYNLSSVDVILQHGVTCQLHSHSQMKSTLPSSRLRTTSTWVCRGHLQFSPSEIKFSVFFLKVPPSPGCPS